jgi:hypothetical protein
MMNSGSLPESTSSGSGVSGGLFDQSSSQA